MHLETGVAVQNESDSYKESSPNKEDDWIRDNFLFLVVKELIHSPYFGLYLLLVQGLSIRIEYKAKEDRC